MVVNFLFMLFDFYFILGFLRICLRFTFIPKVCSFQFPKTILHSSEDCNMVHLSTMTRFFRAMHKKEMETPPSPGIMTVDSLLLQDGYQV